VKIAIGSDHNGFDLKENVVTYLEESGHEVNDVGSYDNRSCDYPDYAGLTARLVSTGQAELGVLICATGIGMAITANKFRGVRAAVCGSPQEAELSRQHNHANVLCLGERFHDKEANIGILKTWLKTTQEEGRHQARVKKIALLEQETLR